MSDPEKLSKHRHRRKMSALVAQLEKDLSDDRPSFVRYCERWHALYGDWPDPEEEVAKFDEDDDD